MTSMSRGSIREYAEVMREQYIGGGKKEKGQILREFTRVAGYHRKAVIRLMNRVHGPPGRRRGRPRRYGPEVVEVLKRHGELEVSEGVARELREMSAATIDRLLRPYKSGGTSADRGSWRWTWWPPEGRAPRGST